MGLLNRYRGHTRRNPGNRAGPDLNPDSAKSGQRWNVKDRPVSSYPYPALVICVTPKALRPPAIAAMIGCTPGFVEDSWRNGSLKYKIVGDTRVSTVAQIDEWFAKIPEHSGAMRPRGRLTT